MIEWLEYGESGIKIWSGYRLAKGYEAERLVVAGGGGPPLSHRPRQIRRATLRSFPV